MEYTGPPLSLLIGVGIVAAVCVILLVFRMMRSGWTPMSDDVARARLARANICSLLSGGFALAILWAVAVPRPIAEMQAAATLVGIFLGFPMVAVALVALYNSVLLWRTAIVWALWGTSLLFVLASVVSKPWFNEAALVFALLTIALALRGLTKRGPREISGTSAV